VGLLVAHSFLMFVRMFLGARKVNQIARLATESSCRICRYNALLGLECATLVMTTVAIHPLASPELMVDQVTGSACIILDCYQGIE